MEQNEDIAPQDQDTIKMPGTKPSSPENDSALENAETERLPVAGANDVSHADTVRVPAVVDTVADAPTRRVPAAAPATPVSPRRAARFVWLRHPEFWLVLALAAFLRLWHIGLTQVLDDQAQLLTLARDAWLRGALPVTGIPSSINTLNPPLSVYLLMPFTLFGKDPLLAAIAIALWNVLGVAFCYIFARRYFGRIVAASSALLFATSGMAVNYSRFIWQQNWLPPIVALWILTLYLGCVSGKRGWFVPHVALLAIAILLHPVAALLLPISLVGFILSPRQAMPSLRQWGVAGGLVVLLLAPTVVWEALSAGSDISLFREYLTQGSSAFDLKVFGFLANLLGAPGSDSLGAHTLYAQTSSWSGVVNAAMVLCFVGGLIVLTERLARVSVHVWREGAARDTNWKSRARGGALAIWRGLRAEPAWRAYLLLWLWIVLPIVLLLRHDSALYVHYLLILYPAVFIAGGFTVQAAFQLAGRLLPRAGTSGGWPPLPSWRC